METFYINIGTEKSCLFVHMSLHMIRQLEMYPLLYYAIEEAMKCAEMKYYSIGILTFSELMWRIFKVNKPKARHIVAHESFNFRPHRKTYDDIMEKFKEAAKRKYEEELLNRKKDQKNYHEEISRRWNEFQSQLERPCQ